jgi:hypothetical protein
MANAGGIVEITFNHPTIGSGVLRVKTDEDSTYRLGGIITKDDPKSVDGRGKPIWILENTMGFFEVVCVNDQNVKEDLEKVSALAADLVPAQWTFEIINGVTYGGTGKPVGELDGNINQGTFKLKVLGAKFKKMA